VPSAAPTATTTTATQVMTQSVLQVRVVLVLPRITLFRRPTTAISASGPSFGRCRC
jgi:hypothetical protein